MGWDTILRQLDHLIATLGEDHVAPGSVFDGCNLPELMGDATGVPHLLNGLSRHGFGDDLLAKLARDTWLACSDRSLN